MDIGQLLGSFIGANAVVIAIAVFIIVCVLLGVRIVPQSEKHVVEGSGACVPCSGRASTSSYLSLTG